MGDLAASLFSMSQTRYGVSYPKKLAFFAV